MTTRRTFLKASSLAAVAAAGRSSRLYTPAYLRAPNSLVPLGELPRATDPQLKALAMRALDAAKSAGASYADVRFTVTHVRSFENGGQPTEENNIAVGVRALAKGAWGFSAQTDWSPDAVAQLGRAAAEQAQSSSWPNTPPIELVDRPPAAVGNWVTPIKRDPFSVPAEETIALMKSANDAVYKLGGRTKIVFIFQRQERTFASTDGAFITQTVYTSLGNKPHTSDFPSMLLINARPRDKRKSGGSIYLVPVITPTGAGYEVLDDAKILEHIPEWYSKAQDLADQMLIAPEFDKIGQYDIVFDAGTMAGIVDKTFGTALEYDRAVGYEANAEGTSYIAPPLKVLGTSYAPSMVTITADRTMPGCVGTVKWDDEGIATAPFPLIKNGVVVDYATSREFVSELAPWYKKQGHALHSNGCSASEGALTVPLVYTPNLILQPGPKEASMEDLMANIQDGLAVFGGGVQMDLQQTSGQGSGEVYVIKNGKLGGLVKNARYSFRTQDFWKNLVALGGPNSAETSSIAESKGEPNQVTMHSVRAVPAHFEKVQVNNAKSG